MPSSHFLLKHPHCSDTQRPYFLPRKAVTALCRPYTMATCLRRGQCLHAAARSALHIVHTRVVALHVVARVLHVVARVLHVPVVARVLPTRIWSRRSSAAQKRWWYLVAQAGVGKPR